MKKLSKSEINKRIEELRKQSSKLDNEKTKKTPKEKRVSNDDNPNINLFCPFKSDFSHDVPCNSSCRLWDGRRKAGFECVFRNLEVISFNTSSITTKNKSRYAK